MQPLEIQKLFADIVKDTAQINSAFMNWSDVAIKDSVLRYNFLFLKTDKNETVSMICFQKNSEFIEILALGTPGKFQRRGYSEKLLLYFLDECGSTSKFVTLEVHSENNRAIALYEKCGFKTVRIRKNYYSDGGSAVVMDKSNELIG